MLGKYFLGRYALMTAMDGVIVRVSRGLRFVLWPSIEIVIEASDIKRMHRTLV